MKKLLGLILFILTVTLMSGAEEYSVIKSSSFIRGWEKLGNVKSYTIEEGMANIKIEEGKNVRFYFLQPDLVRVRLNRENKYARKDDNTYAVIKKEFGKTDVKNEENENTITLSTDVLKIEISKKPFRFKIVRDGKDILTDGTDGISWNDNRIVSYKKLEPNSLFYGFGEKTGKLVKNGTTMTMWNTDSYKYNKESDAIYASIPFFMEINEGYVNGILFDNTYQSFYDIGNAKKDEYYFGAANGEMNYYFISGKNTKEIISKYTELTGRITMPPKWALGYQQSRYSYTSDKRLREIADKMRKERIPCDVLYLDIDFMSGNRSFTWNTITFPDVPKMTTDLHKQGFKLITIIDPGVAEEKGYDVYESGKAEKVFVKTPYGGDASGAVWPGNCVFPDFTNPKTKEWWGKQYIKMVDAGFDAFWNDMNEPSVFDTPDKTLPLDSVHFDFNKKSPHTKVHNIYGQEMARATLEGLDKIRGDKRNFVLSRAGYAGIQRYAAMWTGDNSANWEHLKLNVTMCLGLGLSGVPITGADVGGYTGTPSPELFARWMELGAFIPMYRNHTEKDTDNQEPWEFGKEVEDISRKYIEMRYKMMPYLYDIVRESNLTGLPVIRPLFMEFAEDKKCYGIEDEYMYGDEILVAPVLDEGAVKREVYLPNGSDWYGLENGIKYEGGKSYTIDAPLNIMPLFVRSGAIIPETEIVQYIGEKEEKITLNIYPGKFHHTLYNDDGETKGYIEGKYNETGFDTDEKEGKLKITINKIKEEYKKNGKLRVKISCIKKPVKISINNDSVEIKEYIYKEAEKNVYLEFEKYPEDIVIE